MAAVFEPSFQRSPTASEDRNPHGEAGWPAAPATDPWMAPPPPPWPGHGGHWPPQPQPPRRHPLRWMMVIIIVVVAVAFASVVIARGSWRAASGSGANPGVVYGGGAPTAPGATAGQATTPAGSSLDPSAIAAAVDPAVVNIETTLGLQQARAAGTGIVLSSSGEVLTNNHVINGATSITATDVGDGRTYQASVVGYDRSHDLAVIQLRGAANLPTASIGDSSKVAAGDSIVAIGNAGGRGGTPAAVTGTVTAVDQAITASDETGAHAERLTGLIQVAADIQPGDSGGPLVDSAGHVVGVDTAATASFQFQTGGGAGFAIPINQAISVAKEIEAGRASATVHIGATAFLGVQIASAGGNSGSGRDGGAAITAVVQGSPADQAGLTRGDLIVSVDGATVDSPSALTNLLTSHHPGDRVTIATIDRVGQARTVTLRLATGPAG